MVIEETNVIMNVPFGGQPAPPLKNGDDGGTLPPMESRVSKLEAHMEHVQEDFKEIKADLKSISEKLSALNSLPTKGNLLVYTLASLAIALAIIGAIIGGLDWIKS